MADEKCPKCGDWMIGHSDCAAKAAHTPTIHGSRVAWKGGYAVEITSPHREWVDKAIARINAHDELVAALEKIELRLTLWPIEPAMRLGARGGPTKYEIEDSLNIARAILAKVSPPSGIDWARE